MHFHAGPDQVHFATVGVDADGRKRRQVQPAIHSAHRQDGWTVGRAVHGAVTRVASRSDDQAVGGKRLLCNMFIRLDITRAPEHEGAQRHRDDVGAVGQGPADSGNHPLVLVAAGIVEHFSHQQGRIVGDAVGAAGAADAARSAARSDNVRAVAKTILRGRCAGNKTARQWIAPIEIRMAQVETAIEHRHANVARTARAGGYARRLHPPGEIQTVGVGRADAPQLPFHQIGQRVAVLLRFHRDDWIR